MKIRHILSLIALSLVLVLLLFLAQFLFPPPPLPHALSELLPDSPVLYLHCSDLQERLTDFTQHEQYQRILKTPYLQQMLQHEEGQAQIASFQNLPKDKLLGLMPFLGKELAFALYRNSSETKTRPAAVLLSRVNGKARLTERILYGFDRLTGQLGVEKLPSTIRDNVAYEVRHQDLLVPLYYTLVNDVAVVTSSPELLETVVERISEEEEQQQEPKTAELFNSLVREQPENRFLTAFADPPALAEELSSNVFFSTFYITHFEYVKALQATPPLFSTFDIFPESIRLHVELPRSPQKRSASPSAKPANRCWEESERIGQFPLLLDIAPDRANALIDNIQDIFPRSPEWRNPYPDLKLWNTAIECRIDAKPVGTVYALPDLMCASDSPLAPEENVAAVRTLLNSIIEQQVPPMLRNSMLRQERKRYQDVPVESLQVMFQDIFSYTALTNAAGDAFTILASNSPAVRHGIDRALTEEKGQPAYCITLSQEQTSNAGGGDTVPAAGLWVHPRVLARFIEDFSQTNSFELLFPRRKNPELYAQLPQLWLILRSLPPMYLELGQQEENPTAKLWSRGYYH